MTEPNQQTQMLLHKALVKCFRGLDTDEIRNLLLDWQGLHKVTTTIREMLAMGDIGKCRVGVSHLVNYDMLRVEVRSMDLGTGFTADITCTYIAAVADGTV